ncbi:MAG: hypothetical protein EPO63_08515 [Candidatus Nitrosotenuis sp.]|nr:MAG: hypothetical protein EPO63_08515 [Candidatus Nitrosotenuis sp.]
MMPLAGAVHAAGPAPASRAAHQMDADTDVNELLFGGTGSGYILASERKFVVTPRTEFFGKSGARIASSSIRKGSMVKVVFHRESDGATLTAVSVTVTKDPQ